VKNFLIVVVLLYLTGYSYSQVEHKKDLELAAAKSEKLFVGEDLTYIVKYAFFNLGEIRLKVLEKSKINNRSVYKTIAYIDSYPDLPFVSLHQIYESYIDTSLFPLKFVAEIFGEDTVFVEYNFNENSRIDMKKGKFGEPKLWIDSTTYINHRLHDGLSILYFARMNFGEQRTVSVPCFVNEKEEKAVINYYNESEPVAIDAVDYEVDCLRLDGRTDFVSVYGLTGNFEGWFSNDSFSVPIRAKMNVIIGSIDLELIKWNEHLWNPPSCKN